MDALAFEREARRILQEVEAECGWMYETRHKDGSIGKINYTVWSDVFVCPQCGEEMVFWDVAVDHEQGKVRSEWPCPGCGVTLSKRPKKDSGALRVERAFESRFDRALGQTVRQAKQAPVLINYSVGKKRHEKRPDAHDLVLIERIEQADIPYPFPTDAIPKGDKTGDPFNVGITHVHHFYTRRNLWVLAAALSKQSIKGINFWVTASCIRTSKMYKFTLDRKMGTVSGTLYIPSLWVENSPFKLLRSKIGRYTE